MSTYLWRPILIFIVFTAIFGHLSILSYMDDTQYFGFNYLLLKDIKFPYYSNELKTFFVYKKYILYMFLIAIYIRLRTFVLMRILVDSSLRMSSYMCMCVCVCISGYVRWSLCVCMDIYTYVYLFICTHAYIQ